MNAQEQIIQAATSPKVSAAIAAGSTGAGAAGIAGLLSHLNPYFTFASLSLGIILSSILIVFHGVKLWRLLTGKDD